jgi:predicted transcriptional regulator
MPTPRQSPRKVLPSRYKESHALAFRLPGQLVAELDIIATAEKRSRANMIEILLEESLRARKAQRAA